MGVDHLLAAAYEGRTVLDISSNALEMAQCRLGDDADQVAWITSDITSYESTESYQLWHDRAVFHFLTEAGDRKRYIDVLRRSLTSQGTVIIAAFDIGGPTMCSGLNIVQYNADKLSNELGSDFRLEENIQEMHTTPGNKQQAFQYFRFTRL